MYDNARTSTVVAISAIAVAALLAKVLYEFYFVTFGLGVMSSILLVVATPFWLATAYLSIAGYVDDPFAWALMPTVGAFAALPTAIALLPHISFQ